MEEFQFVIKIILILLTIADGIHDLQEIEDDIPCNHDLTSITTPINVPVFSRMLRESGYPEEDAKFLIDGFTEGFDLGYNGPTERCDYSQNLPLRVGSQEDLWGKVMKEVKLRRFAGPYDKVPFKNFMQSPIGLVPKAGNKTRLIFHLSYQFGSDMGSVNSNTPEELCKVRYKDLDYAVKASLKLLSDSEIFNESDTEKVLFYSKSDLQSAFRILPLSVRCYQWLVMKAVNPVSKKLSYFADKNLPFGSSISCALFSKFSEALRHLIEYKLGRSLVVTNYLDDFLFIAESKQACDEMVRNFLQLCKDISCPVSLDKTEWGSSKMIFLGILLDGYNHCLCVPLDKKTKALNLLRWILNKRSATVKEIQSLSGYLNFLNKAIVPGRAFTRRMYAAVTLDNLKQHHHVRISEEFKNDCRMWMKFLQENETTALCRPFIDIGQTEFAHQLNFYTDASGAIGYGCSFNKKWIQGFWDKRFLLEKRPSIQYLELYALCVGLLAWGHELTNAKFVIFCDNKAVRDMVNQTTSGCKNCMVLIRIITINNLIFNRRLLVKYVKSKENSLADSLSRGDFKEFWKLNPGANPREDPTPSMISPVWKIWLD